MYKELGKAKNWKRTVVPSIILFGMVSLPVSAFLIYVAVESMELKTFIASILMSAIVFFIPTVHIKNIYVFPPVEIDNNFLVVNQPFQKRAVYTIKSITWIKVIFRGVIMVHNGIPAFVNLNSISKEEMVSLIDLIKAANRVAGGI